MEHNFYYGSDFERVPSEKLAAEKQRVSEIKNGQLTAQRLRDRLDKLGLL